MKNKLKNKFGFSAKEQRILLKLNSPKKIQDYIDSLEYNLEEKGETFYSPRDVMKHGKADCVESAVFAAAALRFHGYPPLLLDITSSARDDDHVVAVFRENGCWGAIGKSKYTFLSFREPVYRTIRELAMSYFELYFNYWGEKTMRSFSRRPFNLARFDGREWMTSEKNIFYIGTQLDKVPHEKLMARGMARRLRRVTPLDREAGELWIRRKGLLKKLKREGY
jgi:hypothetical protein